jgi:hypothetical protein
MNLYKFYWYCGRAGDLEGLFAATQEDVDAAIGKYVYFGEVLGKHSEIYGNLGKEDLTKLNISEDVVSILVKEIGSTDISGYNPLNYLPEEHEEDENDD